MISLLIIRWLVSIMMFRIIFYWNVINLISINFFLRDWWWRLAFNRELTATESTLPFGNRWWATYFPLFHGEATFNCGIQNFLGKYRRNIILIKIVTANFIVAIPSNTIAVPNENNWQQHCFWNIIKYTNGFQRHLNSILVLQPGHK